MRIFSYRIFFCILLKSAYKCFMRIFLIKCIHLADYFIQSDLQLRNTISDAL